MVVESVRVHMLSSQHVVILREAQAERYLPIWIGSWEAQSIAMRLQGVEAERPLTHDLMASVLGELGVSVRHIIVSDLADWCGRHGVSSLSTIRGSLQWPA